MPGTQGDQKKASDPTGTGVTGGWLCMLGTEARSSAKAASPLTADPSLQPQALSVFITGQTLLKRREQASQHCVPNMCWMKDESALVRNNLDQIFISQCEYFISQYFKYC